MKVSYVQNTDNVVQFFFTVITEAKVDMLLYCVSLQSFVCFCIKDDFMSVIYVKTCAGDLCGGLHGAEGGCPYAQMAHLPRYSLRIILCLNTFLMDSQDVCLKDFTSLELTKQLVI